MRASAIILDGETGNLVGFDDYREKGEGSTVARYDYHTSNLLHDGDVTYVLGSKSTYAPYGWARFVNGVALTEDMINERYLIPDVTLYPAMFMTQVYAGALVDAGPGGYWHGTTPESVSRWTHDYGPTQPWAGHEDHTGGAPVVRPKGDLEVRGYWKARRVAPRNATRARLVANLSGPPNYNIGATVWPIDGSPKEDWAHPTLHVKAGQAPAAGPVVEGTFAEIFSNFVSAAPPDDNPLGTIDFEPSGGFDIGFQLGEPGCMGDANWNDRCACFASRYAPGPRYPAEYRPMVPYQFCPFHLGILRLDSEKFGMVSVEDECLPGIQGVELHYPTAAGWGWTEGKYHWIVDGSYEQGWNLSEHSYASAAEGGVLQLLSPSLHSPFPADDRIDYDFQSAGVTMDWSDPGQGTPSAFWAFEVLAYFEGGAGVGNFDFGPVAEVDVWPATLAICPGAGLIQTTRSGWDDIAAPVDLYRPFHLRFVASSAGWATKMWQDGNPVPTDWTDWDEGAVPAGGAIAAFHLWQDTQTAGSYPSPFEPVDIRLVVEAYRVWDLTGTTDPLAFSAWDVPPSGGSVTGGGSDQVGAMASGHPR